MFQKILYYGYGRDIYDSVRELRDQTNARHSRIIASLFLAIMLLGLLMYLTVALLSSFAIFSSKQESFQLATVYHAFLVLFGVAFIDNMLKFSVTMLGITTIFSLTSYYTKPPSIASYDLIYAIVFTGVALVFHFLV